jgi:hypothetical protein
VAVGLASEGATRAVTPGAQAEGLNSTCFWGKPFANIGAINELNEANFNKTGPDTNTAYYSTQFNLPAGATVTLHGEYPHSRFMSLTSYKVVNGEPGIAASALSDVEIAPDAGSVNPFAPGASRDAAERKWTVTISGEVPPPTPAPNTLYVGQEGHTGETQHVEMVYRIYRTDRGEPADGGVELPVPTYNPVGGEPTSSEGEACSGLSAVGGSEFFNTSKVGLPEATYKAIRSAYPLSAYGTEHEFANGVSVHPAELTPRWERFFNNTYLVAPFYRGTILEPKLAELPTFKKEGFWPTPANAYMTAYADRRIGPNPNGENILVLHGKMPTHPDTYQGSAVSEDGSTQVRYWSISNYTAIGKPALLEAGSTSLFDQDVPTNANGEYTIVISLPQDRPANARPGCGVAWMNWGTVGDNLGDPYLDLLVVRNQLSNPTFAQSIERIEHPGEEEAVLGAYYPRGSYTDKELFESESHCEPAAPGAPHLTSGASPNRGAFTLGWTAGGEAESVEGVTFTLQQKSHDGGWETVASGLNDPEYTFAEGSPEAEGGWTYRVKASGETESADSAESGVVKVDRSGPPAPTASAVGSPVYAGWYKDSAEVTFAANGPGTLPDGSEGASLVPSSLTANQTVSSSGTHTVCGTVENVLGEKSAEGCTNVKVDATSPSLAVTCPATAELDASGVQASYSASDGQSGLASGPSGSIAIPTGSLGVQTVSETATDNVGNQTTASCGTDVIYSFSKLKPAAGKPVKAGAEVAVSFRFRDALGYVTDGGATLEIAPASGIYQPATSNVNSGDKFQANPKGRYSYNLNTAGLSKGAWTLRVTGSDGSVHTTTITLK